MNPNRRAQDLPAPCPTAEQAPAFDPAAVMAATRAWLQHAVIGLNLCPFANAVVRRQRLHISISAATEPLALLQDLGNELRRLIDSDEQTLETTLLVCPAVLTDFADFNDFLGSTDELLKVLALDGIIQIASFHPDYQFAGTRRDDISNATNQAPYPTLHLLRESSIDRAVAAWGEDTDRIFEDNIARLQAMGQDGWRELQRHWQPGPAPDPAPEPGTGPQAPAAPASARGS